MNYLEKPQRIDRVIHRLLRATSKRGRRIKRIALNAAESRIFWEDLLDTGDLNGDHNDDAAYAAWVALGNYTYLDVTIRLERNVPDGVNEE
jgi:hypothetical protein